jgi:ribose-phosphate pyrophosphokinase
MLNNCKTMAKAPDIKLFSGSSHTKLAKDIGQILGVELGDITLKRFPDNEIAIEILDDVRDKEVYVVQSIALEPNEYLMELLIIADALKRASARKITAVIPYLGYSRQDRQDKPNVPITAKLVADLLQKAGIDAVITADLHAEQIEGFFDIPVENLHCMPLLVEEISKLKPKDLIVVTQDVGSIKLVSGFASQLHVGMAIINKQRLADQKVQTLQIMGDVKGKDVLLADDMCSTGATLASAAKACQEKGAKRILACVTHGLFVGNAYEEIGQSPIEALITTDTVPFEGPVGKITNYFHVISSAPIFAEAIKRRIS